MVVHERDQAIKTVIRERPGRIPLTNVLAGHITGSERHTSRTVTLVQKAVTTAEIFNACTVARPSDRASSYCSSTV